MTSISLCVYTQHIRRGGGERDEKSRWSKKKNFKNTNMMIAWPPSKLSTSGGAQKRTSLDSSLSLFFFFGSLASLLRVPQNFLDEIQDALLLTIRVHLSLPTTYDETHWCMETEVVVLKPLPSKWKEEKWPIVRIKSREKAKWRTDALASPSATKWWLPKETHRQMCDISI